MSHVWLFRVVKENPSMQVISSTCNEEGFLGFKGFDRVEKGSDAPLGISASISAFRPTMSGVNKVVEEEGRSLLLILHTLLTAYCLLLTAYLYLNPSQVPAVRYFRWTDRQIDSLVHSSSVPPHP